MPYMIDGHNLIPKVHGLHLKQLDDEMALIEKLQRFCRVRRQSVEVYFDGAPAGKSGKRSFGSVVAHFVRQESSADEAIRQKLRSLGKAARNWKVVSSDRRVQAEARGMQAEVVSSEDFTRLLSQAEVDAVKTPMDENQELSDQELAEWLRFFQDGKTDNS